METARKIMVMLFCGIGIVCTGAAGYVALKVFAPGWYKHDNSRGNMTKITNKQIGVRFARRLKNGTRRVFLYDAWMRHTVEITSGVFAYRAPHAPRPTAPKHRFI